MLSEDEKTELHERLCRKLLNDKKTKPHFLPVGEFFPLLLGCLVLLEGGSVCSDILHHILSIYSLPLIWADRPLAAK